MLQGRITGVPINTSYTYYFYMNNPSNSEGWNGYTGLSWSTNRCKISKNGGAFATTTNVPTELANGWYSLTLTSTEMNAQDILLYINDAGQNIKDAVWICTTPQQVDTRQWNGTAVVTPDVAGEPKVTVSDKTGFALTSEYDPAKTAAQESTLTDVQTDVDEVQTDVTAIKTATDSASELSAIPTDSDNLAKKVSALFQYFFNKRTVTATVETLKKSDDSTNLGTATLSDDGTTFTKGKIS